MNEQDVLRGIFYAGKGFLCRLLAFKEYIMELFKADHLVPIQISLQNEIIQSSHNIIDIAKEIF